MHVYMCLGHEDRKTTVEEGGRDLMEGTKRTSEANGM